MDKNLLLCPGIDHRYNDTLILYSTLYYTRCTVKNEQLFQPDLVTSVSCLISIKTYPPLHSNI